MAERINFSYFLIMIKIMLLKKIMQLIIKMEATEITKIVSKTEIVEMVEIMVTAEIMEVVSKTEIAKIMEVMGKMEIMVKLVRLVLEAVMKQQIIAKAKMM